MFIDDTKIRLKAGDGGSGAVAFHREKYVASGGPDGGDGGKGGDILFLADDNMSTLADFRYKKKYRAENGEAGRGKRCNGRKGSDLLIRVPRGTLVKDAETGRLIADISSDKPAVIAKGGRGGWGNSHFATATRQTPRFARPGAAGESFYIKLELKLLADVGLVGYPNVGKSTLISVVSEAKPVIADYPFTTIVPNLGVVSLENGASFVMADIPGLIENASEGAGLGHEFLRHVERCRLLLHIVDVSGSEGRDPKEDFKVINNELRKFNPELAERPMIAVGNKCDLASDERISDFKNFVEMQGYEFFPVMAAIKYQVGPLMDRTAELLSKLPPVKEYLPDPVSPDETAGEQEKTVEIIKSGNVFTVKAEWLVTVLRTINFAEEDSVRYFQRVLMKSGVDDALSKAGVQEGDTVSIYGVEFDYID